MADKPLLYVPVGRLVSGSLTELRTTNSRNQPIPPDKQMFEFGVAVRKDAPETGQMWQQLIAGAKACYPGNQQVHGIIDAWTQNGFNGFSMKVSDGDKPSMRTGEVNKNTAGCLVVWFSTQYIKTANNQNIQIDPHEIKRGYYVDVSANLAPNNAPIGDGVGIYMNPSLVRLIGLGEEIQSGPSIEQIAASMPTAPALPPGATDPSMAPPVSTPPPGMTQQPPAQQYGQPQQQYGQPMGNANPPAYAQQQPPSVPAHGVPASAGQPAPAGQYGNQPMGNANPASHQQASMPPGVPASAGQPAPAGQQGGTASPTNGYPPYTGAMTPPGA